MGNSLPERKKHSGVRYAIYTRQSASDDGKVLSSCEAQFGICEDFVNARADPTWRWVGERLDDVGFTGADTNRPALQRLLRLVREGRIDKVVVYRLDRLTRSLRDSLDILEALRTAGVDLLIVTSPELGSAATDALLLNLMALFAQFEREMIRARLADTRAALKRHGRRLAGRVPYGYDVDSRTKQFVVNAGEARRVRAMFQMAADGMLPREIAAVANEQGWRTKRTVAKRSGKVSGGGPWTPRQVLSLLTNPVYLGLFADGDGTRPGEHPAIVSPELFERAREQIEARRTTKRSRRSAGIQWPLRGKILCSRCGRPMSTHTTHRGPVVYRHYRCRSHAGGRPPCKGSALPAHEIENAVAEILADPSLVDSLPGLTKDQRQLLRRFQVAWDLLDTRSRMRLLPEIVQSVVFWEADSTLELRLDQDGLAGIFSKRQDSSE